jgi:hypothetical protein
MSQLGIILTTVVILAATIAYIIWLVKRKL